MPVRSRKHPAPAKRLRIAARITSPSCEIWSIPRRPAKSKCRDGCRKGGVLMDEQPPDWLVIMREDVEAFRSDLRFVLDDMHQALDAADGAPWTKPGDLTVPIETAVT